MHEGKPSADEYSRGTDARERLFNGARGVTERQHTATDQDERARPKAIGDELDSPGPAEHREPVESDGEPGDRGASAAALERRSEECEEAQYHRSLYQRNPYHYQCPGLDEDTADLYQWPFPLLLGEGFRLRQPGEQNGKRSTGEGRSRESEPPAVEVCGKPPEHRRQGRTHGRGCHQIRKRLLP